jgi:Tol biopolymer transport system component
VRIEAVTPDHIATTVGAEVTPAPAVRALDAKGQPVAGLPIVFKLGQPGGVLARPGSLTDTNGLATVVTWTLGPTVGAQTLIASSMGLADVVFTAMTAVGPAARITRVSGNDQIAAVHRAVAQPLVMRVGDAFGNSIAGATVTFRVTGGSGSIVAGLAVTDADGIARSGPWTLGPETGIQQVQVESGAATAVFLAFAFAPTSGFSGRLAFVSIVDSDAEIYSVNGDGSDLKRLTMHAGLDHGPAWSPNGGEIAFASHRGGRTRIYLMSADGSEPEWITDGVADGLYEMAWAPSGSAIAFTLSGSGIATVRLPDGVPGVLVPGLSEFSHQPSWSPDGLRLAYVGATDYASDIYPVNADGSDVTRHTQGFGTGPDVRFYYHPAWSPDGSTIAYVYGTVINNEDMRFRVAVMSAEGVFLKDLAWAGDIPFRGALSPGSLAWSPDGRGIAYTFYDCDLVTTLGCTKVRSVNYVSLDGSQQSRLFSNAQSPTWRP